MSIALIGHTGSGKTTLAEKLAEQMDIPYVSSGDIARRMAKEDPATRIALERGDYAPEGAMRNEVRHQIETAALIKGGYILEGFPRRTDQLVCLMQWVAVEPMYVWVDTPIHECIRRLIMRKRDDDVADGIAAKIDFFNENTMKMLAVLADNGSYLRVDGLLDVDEQVSQILERVG